MYVSDKATEGSWSALNIESEKELMAMGLASLEVMDEAELYVSLYILNETFNLMIGKCLPYLL